MLRQLISWIMALAVITNVTTMTVGSASAHPAQPAHIMAMVMHDGMTPAATSSVVKPQSGNTCPHHAPGDGHENCGNCAICSGPDLPKFQSYAEPALIVQSVAHIPKSDILTVRPTSGQIERPPKANG